MELSRLIQHPEDMNRETLYDLRALVALYPYYQTARLLMLQNLYLLHDPSFTEELRQAAIYITDRKVIFKMVEAAHYQIKKQTSTRYPHKEKDGADRTSALIDNFLGSIPQEVREEKELKDKKRKPTPADAAVDYVAYLMETEDNEESEKTSRTISLIDDFIEDGGFKLPKIDSMEEYKPEYTPQLEEGSDCKDLKEEQTENSGVFTETLARIYIKQGKYERALQIIQRLDREHPQKFGYYKDQMRFLEKLIVNNKKA